MICLNCKKQIPDDSTKCIHCDTEVFHKHQLKKEIGLRRWQRWFFYVIIILVFGGMIGVIVKIYDTNTKLMVEAAGAQKSLTEKSEELETTKSKTQELENLKIGLEEEKDKLSDDLSTTEEELDEKIKEIEEEISNRTWAQETLDKVSAILKTLATDTGVAISSVNLAKIPLADVELPGQDTDGDGLPDKIENALGTDISKKDTDDDGHDDKNEVLGGYNPIGEGSLELDSDIAEEHKGEILIPEEDPSQLWYVGTDGKRYFLGIID